MIQIWKRRTSTEHQTVTTCYVKVFGFKLAAWVVYEFHFDDENWSAS